jgi:hypothetical protein
MDKGISDRSCIALLILCISGLLFQSCGERPESSYPHLADAIDSGALTRGWIPNFLPESSYDIHEMHDISSSRTWCMFNFTPDDLQGLRNAFAGSVDKLSPELKHIDSPKISWWPDFLEDDLDIEMIKELGFALYIIDEPSYIDKTRPVLFAIDWTKGIGYFHRTYSQ